MTSLLPLPQDTPGKAIKHTWAGDRRPATQSGQQSQGQYEKQQAETTRSERLLVHGRPGRRLDDLRRSGARPEIRDHGQKHIVTLRTKEPNAGIEIRWCPSHQGIEGNEIADEWANSPPTSRARQGRTRPSREDTLPPPEILSRLHKSGRRKWLSKTKKRIHLPSEKQKQYPTVARANTRLASAQDKTLPHRPVPPMDNTTSGYQELVVPGQNPDSRTPLQKLPAGEEPAEDPLATVLEEPGSSRAQPDGGIALSSRSCSRMSSAAKQSWSFSRQRTSAGTAGPPVG